MDQWCRFSIRINQRQHQHHYCLSIFSTDFISVVSAGHCCTQPTAKLVASQDKDLVSSWQGSSQKSRRRNYKTCGKCGGKNVIQCSFCLLFWHKECTTASLQENQQHLDEISVGYDAESTSSMQSLLNTLPDIVASCLTDRVETLGDCYG